MSHQLRQTPEMIKRFCIFLMLLYLFTGATCHKSANQTPASKQQEVTRASSPYFDPNGLIASAAVLTKLREGFGFTEGPAVDKAGNVFFTDQPNDKIYKWTASTGTITEFMSGTGRSNGLFFDKDGFLISCADEHGELWSIDAQGKHKVLVENYQGKLLNGPNDLWINPVTGGIYISDPLFPRDYWDANDPRRKGSQQGGEFVYYLSPDRNTLSRVINEDLGKPNGIVGSPDGKKLYVGRTSSGVMEYDINADGSLSNGKPFVSGQGTGGDGMVMDERGNIYMTNSQGVSAFDSKGNKVLNVPTGQGWTANLVFAGPDQKTLFITALDKVFTLKMNVKGREKF